MVLDTKQPKSDVCNSQSNDSVLYGFLVAVEEGYETSLHDSSVVGWASPRLALVLIYTSKLRYPVDNSKSEGDF